MNNLKIEMWTAVVWEMHFFAWTYLQVSDMSLCCAADGASTMGPTLPTSLPVWTYRTSHYKARTHLRSNLRRDRSDKQHLLRTPARAATCTPRRTADRPLSGSGLAVWLSRLRSRNSRFAT